MAGNVAANNIARWDGTAWLPLGSGVDYVGSYPGVNALTVTLGGDLIAGGDFATAGGLSAHNIARWNGSTWGPLNSGTNSTVYALAATSDGTLAVGGTFLTAGNAPSAYFARYSFASLNVSGPEPIVACLNSTPVFRVGVTGDEPVTYAWRHDGQVIDPDANPSAATDTLELYVAPADAGVFDCIVTNPCGSVTSNPATLTVLDSADPACGGSACEINVSDPQPLIACLATPQSFHVNASGTGPFTYAWRIDEQRINIALNPSAATDTLELFIAPGDAGSFDCIVTNACSSVTSNAATLTILDPADPACTGPTCNPDVNQDGNVDASDIDYLINVAAGGDNPTNIDPDFNHDGNADASDIDALINVVAGGECP